MGEGVAELAHGGLLEHDAVDAARGGAEHHLARGLAAQQDQLGPQLQREHAVDRLRAVAAVLIDVEQHDVAEGRGYLADLLESLDRGGRAGHAHPGLRVDQSADGRPQEPLAADEHERGLTLDGGAA